MRPLIIAILLISLNHFGHSQTFLDSYKKYRLHYTDTISNNKTRKKVRHFIKSHIVELDTILKSYKAKTNFDFNYADSLFLIYYSPVESPFTSDIIIWSDKDTISYRQEFETIKPFKYKRIISYESFVPKFEKPKGFKVVTERDSLIRLVSKLDFSTVHQLGDDQTINDGSSVSIYVAYKENGKYKFKTCFPKQFTIRDSYKKE